MKAKSPAGAGDEGGLESALSCRLRLATAVTATGSTAFWEKPAVTAAVRADAAYRKHFRRRPRAFARLHEPRPLRQDEVARDILERPFHGLLVGHVNLLTIMSPS